MDIEYRKGTLYVYLKTKVDDNLIDKLERKVNDIFLRYDIDNLVIDTFGQDEKGIEKFCIRHNKKYKNRVLVK